MKILNTISSLSYSSGGTSQCTSLILKELWRNNIDVEVLTYNHSENDSNVLENSKIHFMPYISGRYKYSSVFKYKLLELQKKANLVHIQGIWQYPSYAAVKNARKFKKPYVISPHGMLYPKALNSGNTLLKKIFYSAHLRKDLQQAACIHTTCIEEMNHIRDLGISTPIAVIPNPVDNLPYVNLTVALKNRFSIGYVGRIHRTKRIEVLIDAWHMLGCKVDNDELIIIGDGDKEYLEELKCLVAEKSLKNVKFTGFLKGNDKNNAIQSLTFLAVPSDFESFGMVIAEALMMGVPVIASKGTPWSQLETFNCGYWIKNDSKNFSETILQVKKLSYDEIKMMGENGKKLINDNYTTDVIGQKIINMYNWILNKSSKPEFIFDEN